MARVTDAFRDCGGSCSKYYTIHGTLDVVRFRRKVELYCLVVKGLGGDFFLWFVARKSSFPHVNLILFLSGQGAKGALEACKELSHSFFFRFVFESTTFASRLLLDNNIGIFAPVLSLRLPTNYSNVPSARMGSLNTGAAFPRCFVSVSVFSQCSVLLCIVSM